MLDIVFLTLFSEEITLYVTTKLQSEMTSRMRIFPGPSFPTVSRHSHCYEKGTLSSSDKVILEELYHTVCLTLSGHPKFGGAYLRLHWGDGLIFCSYGTVQ